MYLSRRCFYLTRIPQISRRALAPPVLPFGTFRTLPLSQGKYRRGGEGVCEYVLAPRIACITTYGLKGQKHIAQGKANNVS